MIKLIKNVVCAGVAFAVLSFDLPAGWSKGGTEPAKYDMGIDKGAGHNKTNAATIRSLEKNIAGSGMLTQTFSAKKYTGKRIKLSGYMRTADVTEAAALWMRVENEKLKDPLSFDNMQDRPVKGTTDWKKYEIVLDIPDNASTISFGAALNGSGQLWFDDLSFEVVKKSVPVTCNETGAMKDPVNLDFER